MTSFPTVRIEGSLLGPDMLDQLLAGDLPGQRPADFGLEARRNINDEAAALFNDARALWSVYKNRLDRLPADDLATSVTRDAWMIPFLGLLGYELRYNPRAYDVEGMSFAISHRAGEVEDSPPIHIVGRGQELGRVPASGKPRLAPHSLVQEYLNRTELVWGIVTNGQILRLLRDSTFVRRQAYVEFDLRSMLEEQHFQDFVVLYRLLHRTRLPTGLADGSTCLLERYYSQSVEQGGRVREHLRDGVEACIIQLANGFLSHPLNDTLRTYVAPTYTGPGGIGPESLYRQLLRLIYRLLFLLVSEDRGLLSQHALYREHYGIGRLRRLLDHTAAYTEHDDLWQSLRLLWIVVADEKMAAFLGLPALNGELFEPQYLDTCTIANRDLLNAFRRLAWYQSNASGVLRRVNYAALDVEELGSVYESLLEYHPALEPDSFNRPYFSLIYGSERRTTGSYYTPPQLVHELIRTALEPVIEQRLMANPKNPEGALLSIRVCDPACGSGHFLLAAARTLGKALARRNGEDEPPPEVMRAATRRVIAHCIYGVDKNPLAVDLCRVALWLESHTGDMPLTFLDHHIRCGDSLVGVFDLSVLKKGIPDAAFDPLEGDDRAFAREVGRRNHREREGSRTLFAVDSPAANNPLALFSSQSRAVDNVEDSSPANVRQKAALYQRSHADLAWRRQFEACNLWTAAFFQSLVPKTPVITSAVLADYLARQSVDARLMGQAMVLAQEYSFFHWPLEFPDVFEQGGFDVIVSNPPWERVKLEEQEFFAVRDAQIANAPTRAVRARLIRDLPLTNEALHNDYIVALRAAAAASSILRNSGRYPLTGRGDINTYSVFAEFAVLAIRHNGRAGLIVPTGIATDDTTKLFFGSLVETSRLIDLIGFENEEYIFPAVHHAFKFCKITIGGGAEPIPESRIAFYIRNYAQLAEAERFFSLTRNEFALLNPNTGNCPIFRTQADAELTKAIYRRVPILWCEASADRAEANPWRLSFKTLFHMSNDSHHFRTSQELEADGYRLQGNIYASSYDRYLPLYEAKMVHQFDHRFSTYEGATEQQLRVGILPQPSAEQKQDPTFVVQPRYWVREEVVESAIPRYPEPLATALQLGHRPSIQRVLCWWVAGYYLNRGERDAADHWLETAVRHRPERALERLFGEGRDRDHAAAIATDFALAEGDVRAIARSIDAPEKLAVELIGHFSPKWFLGWRDITNATNERTLIAGTLPKVAVGNNLPLLFAVAASAGERLSLQAMANALVVDYVARQKVGGTHINYFYLKQFPFLSPVSLDMPTMFTGQVSVQRWLQSRALELVYTTTDMSPLAQDCHYDGPPFQWDDARRFELRCELDAAFFHLYLPSSDDGDWKPAKDEGAEQIAVLCRHFPTPRAAVAHVLEQFPIARQKDQQLHGRYRTKERILQIYDRMLVAQRNRMPYKSELDPSPESVLPQ